MKKVKNSRQVRLQTSDKYYLMTDDRRLMAVKFPFSRLQVKGSSMLPTFSPGQFLISFNWAYFFARPKIKDLIVIKSKNIMIIKRVQKVDKDMVFVIGDNPKASTDSRQFGFISKDQIVGKVIFKYN